MKLTQHEWQILAAAFSIVVFPLLYTIIRRHYDQRPDDWERFYIKLVIALVYVAITIVCALGFWNSHASFETIFFLVITVANGFGAYFFVMEAKEAFEHATRPDDN